MYHRCQDKVQAVLAKTKGLAILDFLAFVVYSKESINHRMGFLVANDFYLRIILLYKSNGAAMVRLHVVYHQVVNVTVSDSLMDILYKLGEEIYLYSVYKRYFLILDNVGVV